MVITPNSNGIVPIQYRLSMNVSSLYISSISCIGTFWYIAADPCVVIACLYIVRLDHTIRNIENSSSSGSFELFLNPCIFSSATYISKLNASISEDACDSASIIRQVNSFHKFSELLTVFRK